MFGRLAPALLALLLIVGCAGPAALAERSKKKLAAGEHWRAWELATRALDKAPGNTNARAAASAAAYSIAQDWRQRIHALADVDSLGAAEQVLEFAAFRANAARYTAVSMDADWSREEQTLRHTAARVHYRRGLEDLEARRPKGAYLRFTEAERFVPGYRDASKRADRAYESALTRVAFIPFGVSSGNAALGRDVVAVWRNELTHHVAPPAVHFTRILGGEAIEQQMSVDQLGRTSREEALRLGRKARVERIVWGLIGGVDSDTHLHLFSEVIARRVVEKTPEGKEVARWLDVPIQVVARERTATVDVAYEVIATKSGATIAGHRDERSAGARVVWTSYMPEGDLKAYALISDVARVARPDRAKQIEARWKSVCGEQTTLLQVLEARRTTRGSARYNRDLRARFIAGAAFVFLEDLPPAEDLAFAALAGGWRPLADDLARLDTVDDVDLGVAMVGPKQR